MDKCRVFATEVEKLIALASMVGLGFGAQMGCDSSRMWRRYWASATARLRDLKAANPNDHMPALRCSCRTHPERLDWGLRC